MSIVVEVVQSFDETIEEGKHIMEVNQTGVRFCNFSWDVKIEKDNIFLFTRSDCMPKTTCSLVNGVNILEYVFEIIALLNLPGKQQFSSSSHQFKLDDKYKKMLPESEIVEKEEKFSWEKFLSELEIDKGFVQNFEDANLELDDLKYFTKNDFEAFVKDVVPRIKLMKYVEVIMIDNKD
eukprot:gene5704-9524_t